MSDITDEEIYRQVGQIVNQFDIYQCYDCVKAVMAWLTQQGIKGKVLELKTLYRDEDYIISDRFSPTQSITVNGKHYGVEIKGLVFDNISTKGMERSDWLKDFYCQSEQFLVKELEVL